MTMDSEEKEGWTNAKIKFDKEFAKLRVQTEKRQLSKIKKTIGLVKEYWEPLDKAQTSYLKKLENAGKKEDAKRLNNELAEMESNMDETIEDAEKIMSKEAEVNVERQNEHKKEETHNKDKFNKITKKPIEKEETNKDMKMGGHQLKSDEDSETSEDEDPKQSNHKRKNKGIYKTVTDKVSDNADHQKEEACSIVGNTEEVVKIVLLGQTGGGKSTLGNCLLKDDVFDESQDTDSCTDETTGVTKGDIRVIDCPGLDDSDGRDTNHIENIVEYLKREKYINTFVLVRNGTNKRISKSFKSMLTVFELMFGKVFWEHVILDVSHIRYDEQNPPDEKAWKRALQKDFYKARGAKIPTVFLDASDRNNPKFEANVQKFWSYSREMKDFQCKDFETTMTEIDELKQEKKKREEELKQEKKKHDDIIEQNKLELENFKRSAEEDRKRLLHESEKERIQKEELKQEKKKQDSIIEQHKLDLENFKKQAEEDMKRLLHESKNERIEKEEHEKQHKLDFENFKRSAEKEKKKLQEQTDKKIEEEKEKVKQIEKDKLALQERAEKIIEEEQEKIKQIEKDKLAIQANAEKIIEKEMLKSKQFQDINVRLEEKIAHDQTLEKVIAKVDLVGKDVKEKIEVLEDRVNQQNQNVKEIVSERMASLNEQFEHIEKRLNIQEQKIDHTKKTYQGKIDAMIEEGKKSDNDFENLYPSLMERSDEKRAWKSINKIKVGEKDNYEEYSLKIVESGSVNATDGTKAARILGVSGENNNKSTKTILLVGMTGSGKSTLIDALINYVYDIHYTDPIRLKLISLTSEEVKKQGNQAASQTDHITVYKIGWTPGMNIDFNITLIDTPGLGDTRGIEYDKKMIKNIECVFNSKEVTTLDTIGFVAKSGDLRLTAEQKYIFESVLQIFGKDIGENLVSLLTFDDNHALRILDAFKEANIQFVQHFRYNSQGIFQKRITEKIDRHILTSNPGVSTYQDFYNNSKRFFQSVKSMSPKSLKLTKAVLKDREHIEATVEGLSVRVKELLLLKDKVDQEKRICEQHEADAKANEKTEYEVTEDKVVKIDLEAGEFVTNCLECNRTCHYPCHIQNDDKKYNCAAMVRGQDQESTCCTVCPQKCHWQQHRNMSFRLDIESETVKKTYDDIKNRHKEFLDKAQGQVTIIDALEEESQSLSNEIQSNVDFITECLHRLSQNALRTSTTSSSDYIEQMIQAEDHERKPGFQRRINQLQKEKAKADYLADIASGKPITSSVHISAKKVEKAPNKSITGQVLSLFKK